VRVELTDCNGYPAMITSQNPKLIGDWFAEHAPGLMTADCRSQARIAIWPQSHEEMKTIGQQHTAVTFTQDGLLYLAGQILEAAQALGEIEAGDRT
jgi:hypothetical protein